MRRTFFNFQKTKHESGILCIVLHPPSSRKCEAGFTLLEIIMTVAIVAVLMVAITVVVNPVEQINRAQDGQRSEEVSALDGAIRAVRSDIGGSFDPDGPLANSCIGEASQTVYVSVIGTDANGTCNPSEMPNDLPTGWTYRCAPNIGSQDVDGTGWLPVDFNASAAVGLSSLPLDPDNTFASGYYYTYVCGRAPSGFEITTRIKSEKFKTSGSQDAQSDDGGDDIFVFEKGPNLTLNPKAPVAYWPFGEGSGTVTDDINGENDGTLSGSPLPLWLSESSCIQGNCLDFDGTYGSDSIVNAGEDASLDITANMSVVAWVYADTGPGVEGRTVISKYDFNGGTPNLRGWNFGAGWIEDRFSFKAGNLSGTESGAKELNFFANNLGAWKHVVGTFEPNIALRFYRDGTERNSETVSVIPSITYSSSADPFLIGRRSVDPQSEFDGRIDEVMIYDRTLSPVEIAYQYEALKP